MKASDNHSTNSNKQPPIDSSLNWDSKIGLRKCWEISHSNLAFLSRRKSSNNRRSGLTYFRNQLFRQYMFSLKLNCCIIYCPRSNKWCDKCWPRRNNLSLERWTFLVRKKVFCWKVRFRRFHKRLKIVRFLVSTVISKVDRSHKRWKYHQFEECQIISLRNWQ